MRFIKEELIGKPLPLYLKNILCKRTNVLNRKCIEEKYNVGNGTISSIIHLKSKRKITDKNFSSLHETCKVALMNIRNEQHELEKQERQLIG